MVEIPDEPSGPRNSHIQSLARAFSVLDAIAQGDDGEATLANLSARTGLNRTTVWRLVTNLCELGVARANGDGRFTLGPRLVTLGVLAREQLLTGAQVPAILVRLRDTTGETCHLAAPSGDRMVYLDKVESTRAVRAASRIGADLELYCTALGKAYLAFLDEELRDSVIGRMTFRSRTQRSITNPDDLRTELARTRKRGWALDDEENEEDIRCVAAPVLDGQRQPVAAVSVSVPVQRLAMPNVPKLAAEVLRTAEEVSEVLRSRI